MYLYKTDNFFHINHYLKPVLKVALLHRFYCTTPTANHKCSSTNVKVLGMTWMVSNLQPSDLKEGALPSEPLGSFIIYWPKNETFLNFKKKKK